jgi:DNA-binding MurR/RpiR family transcriptional regulator
MARFFVDHKQAVLLGSAAEIAELAGSSDATVVRTARSLGFEGLSALREKLLADLTGQPSPAGRLKRTLAEAGDGPAAVLTHVIAIHESATAALKRPEMAARFVRSVQILARARQRHVFGIGPSGALADYAVLQFNRIGLPSHGLAASGVGLADRLLRLGKGDAVLMLAYAPIYREVTILLEEAARFGIPVVLVSDSLGDWVGDRVAELLPVPRGKAGHIAMHAGTMLLLEGLIVGLAACRRGAALDSLDRLSRLRGAIDKDWIHRGLRKRRTEKGSGRMAKRDVQPAPRRRDRESHVQPRPLAGDEL